MSGLIRQSLPHVKKRLQKAVDTSTNRSATFTVPDGSTPDEIKDLLITLDCQQLNDYNQIKEALRQLQSLDNQWLTLIQGMVSNTSERKAEEDAYVLKRYGDDKTAGYEEIIQAAESQLIHINANRTLIDLKRNQYCPTVTSTHSVISSPGGILQSHQIPFEPLPTERFSGDIRRFRYFLQRFEHIHSSTRLSNSVKLEYLVGRLDGEPRKFAERYDIIDENYLVVLQALKDEYGSDTKVIETLHQDLLNIPPSDERLESIRKTFNSTETVLLQLQARGVEINDNASKVLWEHKFPEWFRSAIKLQITATNPDYTLVDLRKEADRQLKFRVNSKSLPKKTTVAAVASSNSPPNPQERKPQIQAHRKPAQSPRNFVHRINCNFCKQPHLASNCTKFTTVAARKAYAIENQWCLKCLHSSHQISQCYKTHKFKCCNNPNHHPALCPKPSHTPRKSTTAAAVITSANTTSPGSNENPATITPAPAVLATSISNEVLLPSALITLLNPKTNTAANALTFLDSGSQSSFIHIDKVKELGLIPIDAEYLNIRTFSNEIGIKKLYDKYSFTIISQDGNPIIVTAYSTDNIIDYITTVKQQNDRLIISNKKPAMLIGADSYWDIIPCEQTIHGLKFMKSAVGPIYCGPIPRQLLNRHSSDIPKSTLINVVTKQNSIDNESELNKLLTKFFGIEDIGIKTDPFMNDDERALELFDASVEIKDNHFHVSWPFKTDKPSLPLNFNVCFKQLKSLHQTLHKKNLLSQTKSYFDDYEKRGYIEECSEIRPPKSPHVHYLPYHVVEKQSKTTPVRVVFNCSFGNPSLNSQLFAGPNLIPFLHGILLRFRQYKNVVLSDIEKAFMNIILKTQERDVVRFLLVKDWNSPITPDNIRIMRNTRTLFGATPSPFILMACVIKMLKAANTQLSLETIKNLYVDNTFTEVHNLEDALEKTQMLVDLFASHSMNLREHVSNLPKFNEIMNADVGSTSVLGLGWHPNNDTIFIQCKFDIEGVITKRKILSMIASLFDPLGLIGPAILPFKIFIQLLWKAKKSWDTPLDDSEAQKWSHLMADQDSSQIAIPRRIVMNDCDEFELHVFADASGDAYAAAAYLRQKSADGKYFVTLISSKSRVAPIKQITIPKLELLAAVVAAKLITMIQTEMSLKFESITLWTDNSCVAQWLHSNKLRPRFIQNCIDKIQAVTRNIKHVRTHENPADLASRGISLNKLSSNALWWNGPAWLSGPEESWPIPAVILKDDPKPNFETEAEIEVVNTVAVQKILPFIDATRFSSWTRIIMVVVNILWFCKNKIKGFPIGAVRQSAELFNFAEICIFRQCQETHPPSTTTMRQLNTVRNKDGVLVCLHRLEKIQPEGLIFIPHCPEAQLLIMSVHQRLFHAGPNQTLNELRSKYWITNGKSYVTHVIKTLCLHCRKLSGKSFERPFMPQLPVERLQFCHPFKDVGIDYGGPINIRNTAKDGPVIIKTWIVLFTCLATRAIHLEFTNGLDAKSFLMAFRRFVARRGRPNSIFTDNGTNFKAAHPTIDKYWICEKPVDILDYLAHERITWTFITEKSPWKGGFYERLIGLTKTALKKAVGRRILCFDDFHTLLTEIEAVLNTRPLTPVEADSFKVLRPIDFIAPHAQVGVPRFEADTVDSDYFPVETTSSKLTTMLKSGIDALERFHQEWKQTYLPALRQLAAFKHSDKGVKRFPKEGELVLIEDESLERAQWKMGLITKLTPSVDGTVRSVELKSSSGRSLKRPINQLYPLEIFTELSNENTADPSSPPPLRRSSRIKAKNIFFVLLISMIPCIFANPCPDVLIDEAKFIHADFCRHSGILILRVNDELCWKKHNCHSKFIRGYANSNGTYCGSACSCPAWTTGCSHYHGKLHDNSTVKIPLIQNTLQNAYPETDSALSFVIQLADGTKHYVSTLNLQHQSLNLESIQCFGEGNKTTGSPAYCAHHHCDYQATRFCTFQTHESVFWIFNNVRIPIVAWGLIDIQKVEQQPRQFPKAVIKCIDGTIYLNSSRTILVAEIKSSENYFSEYVKNSSFIKKLPLTLATSDRNYKLKLIYSDLTEELISVDCPAIDYCKHISCYFCMTELLNPICHPYKIIVITSILLLTFWFIFIWCCCLRRYRIQRSKATLSRGGERKRKLSDSIPDKIVIQLLPSPKLCILIFSLISFPHSTYCAGATAITALSRSCEAESHGYLSCIFEEATELFMQSSNEVSLLLKSDDQVPLGTLTILATARSTCAPEARHFTRLANFNSASIKRCPGMGQCFDTNCAKTTFQTHIEGIGKANELPGISGCVESCGGLGCKCAGFAEACTFYRFFANPISEKIIEIQSCNQWIEEVEFNVTLIGQKRFKENHIVILKEGESVNFERISLTLLQLNRKTLPTEVNVISTDRDAAVIDKFGIAAADIIKCESIEAAREFTNCTVRPNACRCRPADAIVHCDCQDNTVLENYFREAPLPRKIHSNYLRKVGANIIIESDARLQVKVGLQGLQLSTVVDRNRCKATVHSLTGCVNCLAGAMLNISCETDFGSAEGHVNCPTVSFALRCSKIPVQQSINIRYSQSVVKENCSLSCPAQVTEMIVEGVLWKARDEENWSPVTTTEVTTPSIVIEAIHSLKDFFFTNYFYLIVLIVLFIVLVVVLKLL